MKCPGCDKTISDSSQFCPFCGMEQEIGYCRSCGTPVGAKSSKKSGMVLLIILLLAGVLVYFTGDNEVKFSPSDSEKNTFALEKKAESSSLTKKVSNLIFKDEKEEEYDVLFSTTIDFGDSKTHEIYLLVKEGESKHNQVEFAKREIRAKSDYEPKDIVVLYICDDSACREKGNYLAKLVSVNLELNPDYKVKEGLEPLSESLFLKWKEANE